jgi:hypothetical protein
MKNCPRNATQNGLKTGKNQPNLGQFEESREKSKEKVAKSPKMLG